MSDRKPRKGDRFTWHGVTIEVTRASDTWADINVYPPFGLGWTKRQPLPFPAEFVAVTQ